MSPCGGEERQDRELEEKKDEEVMLNIGASRVILVEGPACV